MIVMPAIDLKDGQCVRLRRGDYDTVYRVAEDAVKTAEYFLGCGAERIHMVDLDGAKDGVGKNTAVIREVIEKTGACVELGGGIRNMEDLKRVFSLGVSRAVIGSAAVENPDFVKEAVALYGDAIAVGLDVRNNTVRTRGWREDSAVDYLEFAKKMESFGVKTLIYTDIETDGMLTGPNLEALKTLKQTVSCHIVASGGISSQADLDAVQRLGVEEVITGKAVYSGGIDLKEAIRRGGTGMNEKKIIPCLDVKDGRVVKGINFAGMRDAGDPVELAAYYCEQGADELVFLDITATTDNRKTVADMVAKTAKVVTVPLTVGGGIRTVEDFEVILNAGADKVSVNSAAVKNPQLLKDASQRFGSEKVVLAVDARENSAMPSGYEVYVAGGTKGTGKDVIEWSKEGEALGAGSILLTSMDRDGTKEGFDLPLTRMVTEAVSVPVIASGGCGTLEHFGDVFKAADCAAALAASLFHYRELTVPQVKEYLKGENIPVRM